MAHESHLVLKQSTMVSLSLHLLLCATSKETTTERCVVYLLSFIFSENSFFLSHHIQFSHELTTWLTPFLLLWCCRFSSVTSKRCYSNEDVQELLMKLNVMKIIWFQYFFYSQSEHILIKTRYNSHLYDHNVGKVSVSSTMCFHSV